MTGELGVVKGDPLQKMGSAGFIIGAILIATGSLLLPPAAVPSSNWQQKLNDLGRQTVLLQACALLLTFGYWAAMIGLASVYRSITANGSAWARIGFYFSLIGTAIWTIGMSLDVSYAAAIANWMAAPPASKEAAHGLIAAIPGFGRGLFPFEVIVIWLAIGMIGIGITQSRLYPRWVGWIALILGSAGVLIGTLQTFTGREALFIFYIGLLTSTALWWLAIGTWVARKAW